MLLWSAPLLFLILVWTNPFHHLMWDMETITRVRGLVLLTFRYQIFFWIHVTYAYILVIMASLLLVIEMVQRPGVYRIQVSLIIIGIVAPWVGSLIFVGIVKQMNDLDFTPLLFLPTGLGLSWAITRYRLLEILPLEHLTVLKNMADGVIVINQNKRVLYINPLIELLLHCSEAQVLGQPLNYISKEYGEAIASSEHQSEIKIGEGTEARIFEANITPVSSQDTLRGQSGPDRMIILHDITERKKSEIALSRRESLMSAIGLAAEQFLKEAKWEHNIPGVLEKIGQAANVSRVSVFMNYSDDKGVIYSSECYEWSAPGIMPQINNPKLQHINLGNVGFNRWVEQLSRGRSIQGLVCEFPESEQAILQNQNILSTAIVPIFVDDVWWGFIGFDECTYERYWTGTELEVLHITASLFGSAEIRARTEQKLIRRQQSLSLLQDIVSQALQAKSLKDMIQDSVTKLAKLISAKECFITLSDEGNTQSSPLAIYGTSKDTYLALQPVSGEYTFTELALHLGHTLIVNDVHSSSYVDYEIAKQCPSRSLIVVPLQAAQNKFGALILSFKEIHFFQPEEISICEQAASLLALAFEKFKAVEQAQRRAATSEVLRKAGAAITGTLEIDETVTRILEQLKQVIHYATASVQLLNGNELEIIGGSGFDDPKSVIGLRFPIPGNNPNTIVMQTGEPYVLPEISDVYGGFQKSPSNHIRSWLGLPLIFQEQVIGLLAIDSDTPNHFTQENIRVAMEFASQVSIALENSRIYEKAQNQAITDALTGVYNRHGLFEQARVDFSRSNSLGYPFSGIMIDLDHFKKINDTYGHFIGDQVLREFAKRCKSCVREMDYVGRYGGEEFIIILPETNIETSLIVAERLRAAICSKPVKAGEKLELDVTASLGVAQKDEHTTTLEMLITRADQAMYMAKDKGRNRVAVSH